MQEQSLMECWTTGGKVKLWEGPIGSNCWPVWGPFSDTVLAGDGTRVPGDFELCNCEKLVAKGNHTGISEPCKQIVLVEVEPGTPKSQFLTVGVNIGPYSPGRVGLGEVKRMGGPQRLGSSACGNTPGKRGG